LARTALGIGVGEQLQRLALEKQCPPTVERVVSGTSGVVRLDVAVGAPILLGEVVEIGVKRLPGERDDADGGDRQSRQRVHAQPRVVHYNEISAEERQDVDDTVMASVGARDGRRGVSDADLAAARAALPPSARADTIGAATRFLGRLFEQDTARNTTRLKSILEAKQPDLWTPDTELEKPRRAALLKVIRSVIPETAKLVAARDCAVEAIAAIESPVLVLAMKLATGDARAEARLSNVPSTDAAAVEEIRAMATAMVEEREAAHVMEHHATGRQVTSDTWCAEVDRLLLRGRVEVVGPLRSGEHEIATVLKAIDERRSNKPAVAVAPAVPRGAEMACDLSDADLGYAQVNKVAGLRPAQANVGAMAMVRNKIVDVFTDGEVVPGVPGGLRQVDASDQAFIALPVRDKLAKLLTVYVNMLRASSARTASGNDVKSLCALKGPNNLPMDVYVCALLRADMMPATATEKPQRLSRTVVRRVHKLMVEGRTPLAPTNDLQAFLGAPSPLDRTDRTQAQKVAYAVAYVVAVLRASSYDDATQGYSWFGTNAASRAVAQALFNQMLSEVAGAPPGGLNHAMDPELMQNLAALRPDKPNDVAQLNAAVAAPGQVAPVDVRPTLPEMFARFETALEGIVRWKKMLFGTVGTTLASQMVWTFGPLRRIWIRWNINSLLDMIRIPVSCLFVGWVRLGNFVVRATDLVAGPAKHAALALYLIGSGWVLFRAVVGARGLWIGRRALPQ